jgi:hypothetical protein
VITHSHPADTLVNYKKWRKKSNGAIASPPHTLAPRFKRSRVQQQRIGVIMNTKEISALDLAADYKARGIEKSSSYSLFVRDRHLTPELDAKDFFKLFEKAEPRLLPRSLSIEPAKESELTHWIRAKHCLPTRCQLLSKTDDVFRYVTDFGVVCSSPAAFIDVIEPLTKDDWTAKYIYKEAVEVECAMGDDITPAELARLKMRAQYLLDKLQELEYVGEDDAFELKEARKNLEESIEFLPRGDV